MRKVSYRRVLEFVKKQFIEIPFKNDFIINLVVKIEWECLRQTFDNGLMSFCRRYRPRLMIVNCLVGRVIITFIISTCTRACDLDVHTSQCGHSKSTLSCCQILKKKVSTENIYLMLLNELKQPNLLITKPYLIDGFFTTQHALNFSHRFSFRLGNNEQYENYTRQAHTGINPECLTDADAITYHVECGSNQECE
jgi:hypothetical protein